MKRKSCIGKFKPGDVLLYEGKTRVTVFQPTEEDIKEMFVAGARSHLFRHGTKYEVPYPASDYQSRYFVRLEDGTKKLLNGIYMEKA